jgi:hypothetical protein
MNSWLFIRRLRAPAFIILVGITALLNQWGVLRFGHSWPLYLILAGVLMLAERAAIAAAPPAAPPAYPPVYPGAYAPATYSPSAYAPPPAYTGPASESQYAPDPHPGSPAGEDPLAGSDRRS